MIYFIWLTVGILAGYIFAKHVAKEEQERRVADQLYWEYMTGKRTLGSGYYGVYTPSQQSYLIDNNPQESE